MTGPGASRLSGEQPQEIADRTLRSLDSLYAGEALARYDIRGHRVAGEVLTDEATGKPFHRDIWAYETGDEVVLVVAISPEPRVVRHARRFKLLNDWIEGWRSSRESVLSHKVLRLKP